MNSGLRSKNGLFYYRYSDHGKKILISNTLT